MGGASGEGEAISCGQGQLVNEIPEPYISEWTCIYNDALVTT
jgi:hypothetical protein